MVLMLTLLDHAVRENIAMMCMHSYRNIIAHLRHYMLKQVSIQNWLSSLFPMLFINPQIQFLFLGASPCTDWLGDICIRDEDGFIVTGADAGAAGSFETSIPGVYAVGDVRAGSIKRVASAVGEGSMAVRLVHQYLAAA